MKVQQGKVAGVDKLGSDMYLNQTVWQQLARLMRETFEPMTNLVERKVLMKRESWGF